jgi:RNA polymerase sigma-70 factor (ECF subfamily)
MSSAAADDRVVRHLQAAHRGESASLDVVFEVAYDELKRLARLQLSRERAGHTLQPTALVHEAYLRLVAQHSTDLTDRARFLGLVATMMRRVLVNHARDRNAAKRGAGALVVTLSAADQQPQEELDLLGLHDAIDALTALDARQGRVVELKYFAGLEIDEIASLLEVSSATVRRDWTMARMFLGRALGA